MALMMFTGALSALNDHEVIVEGPLMVQFTPSGVVFSVGDNFNPSEKLKSLVAGRIVQSVASLISDVEIKEDMNGLAGRLLQSR